MKRDEIQIEIFRDYTEDSEEVTSSDQDDELKDDRRLYVNDGLIEQEERLNLIGQK